MYDKYIYIYICIYLDRWITVKKEKPACSSFDGTDAGGAVTRGAAANGGRAGGGGGGDSGGGGGGVGRDDAVGVVVGIEKRSRCCSRHVAGCGCVEEGACLR